MSGAGGTDGSTPVWRRPWIIGLAALLLGFGIAHLGDDAGARHPRGSGAAAASSSAPDPADRSSVPAPVRSAAASVASVPETVPETEAVPVPLPAPAPLAAPVPVPQSAPGPGVVYENCDDVRAHGAAPIHRGDPGWQQQLDPDGNGVGCEP